MIFGSFLTQIFGSLSPIIAIVIIAILMGIMAQLPYKFFVNQDKIKYLKDEQKKLQEQIKEAQKESNLEKSTELMNKSMKLSGQLMQTTFKALGISMIISLGFLFILFPWLRATYTQPIVILPFSLPVLGNHIGWLAWYLIVSIPLTLFLRKIMGIEM